MASKTGTGKKPAGKAKTAARKIVAKKKAVSAKSDKPWLSAYPSNVDWDAEIPERRLYALMDHAVERYPKNEAIDFLGKTYTYADIGDMVDRAAEGLQKIGVHNGIKVGLFLPNTPYSVIGFFAILKAGGTVVNYNPLYAERELIYQIENSETDFLITLDLKALYDKVPALLEKSRLKKAIICRMQDVLPFPKNFLFPLLKGKEIAKIPADDEHIRFSALTANDGRPTEPHIDPLKDIAVLQYTGGTTGVPKGAMLSHANLYANTMQCNMWFPSDGTPERIIGVLPLFHVFAMTIVMTYGVFKGSSMILVPRFEIEQLLATVQRTKPTIMPGVPTIFTAINNYANLDKFDLSSLSYCMSGGAALPLEVKRNFEKLTGCTLVEGYGLSETAPVATANPFEGESKEGSIGLPVPRTYIDIVSIEDGKPVPLGKRGEICIRGPQVMLGYWNNRAATKEAMQGGHFHTGDIGTMDEQGYTYIVDRLKEMIIAGGYNVYPRNVEEAIYMHPAVAECAVVGIPDDYRGQSVKAFVVLGEGKSLDGEDLKKFLSDKISKIEMPSKVEFRNELPKSIIGKILKKILLEEEAEKRNDA
ncbi:MAG: long-chain-fatty-acid--CoA ligase [Alphaproteobacteria bacterium]